MNRPLVWLGDSREKISAFPIPAKKKMGFALRVVQEGETPGIAKPLQGLGAGVYEIRQNAGKNTYRVVYAVKLKKAVYVLDAFMKKSKSGKAIPKEIRERITGRLRQAQKIDSESSP